MFALGGFTAFGNPRDDGGQAVAVTGKTRTAKARYRVDVVGMLESFDQPHRVNQERAHDRRVKALVIEHQH
ncbi:hypothetical protein D3C76_1552070 [compost metagenome]